MSSLRTRVSGVVLATVIVSATAFADDPPEVTRAREILKLLIDGKYKEFSAAGDEKMQAAFPPAMAEKAWRQLQFQIGAYQSEVSATPTKVGEFDSVSFVLRFERGTSTLRLVLDKTGHLTGFWCDDVTASGAYDPPDYVNKSAFREEAVTVSAGKYPLPGTLTLPVSTGPHPAIVLVHGSGPHDQDETVGANKPFRDLAWGLASRDVAVLRYVKRTKKHPMAKPPAEWTLEDETIDDAVAAAALLRQRPDIDHARIYVLGHSLGGMAAPYIAQRDPQLAGIILMAGNPRSILDLVEDQVTYLTTVGGQSSPDAEKQVADIKQSLDLIRAGKEADVKEPVLGVPAAYWTRLHKLEQVKAAEGLKCRILVLQGGRDYQVTRKDFELWKQKLGAHPNVTLHLFDKLNHLFVAGEGPSTPAEYQQAGHVDGQVIQAIADWIGGKPAAKEKP